MKSAAELLKFVTIVMVYMASASAEVLVVKVMNYELHVSWLVSEVPRMMQLRLLCSLAAVHNVICRFRS